MARALGPEKCAAAAAVPMTARRRSAWLRRRTTLVPSSKSATGFEGVCKDKLALAKPYMAQRRLMRGGKQEHLGYFASAEEAALAYARALGPSERRSRRGASQGADDGGGGAEPGGGGGARAGALEQCVGFMGVNKNNPGKAKPPRPAVARRQQAEPGRVRHRRGGRARASPRARPREVRRRCGGASRGAADGGGGAEQGGGGGAQAGALGQRGGLCGVCMHSTGHLSRIMPN